jgi:hypothetical protein
MKTRRRQQQKPTSIDTFDSAVAGRVSQSPAGACPVGLRGWLAAQDTMAVLSTNSAHRVLQDMTRHFADPERDWRRGQ